CLHVANPSGSSGAGLLFHYGQIYPGATTSTQGVGGNPEGCPSAYHAVPVANGPGHVYRTAGDDPPRFQSAYPYELSFVLECALANPGRAVFQHSSRAVPAHRSPTIFAAPSDRLSGLR